MSDFCRVSTGVRISSQERAVAASAMTARKGSEARRRPDERPRVSDFAIGSRWGAARARGAGGYGMPPGVWLFGGVSR